MGILIQDIPERLFKYYSYDENTQLTESFEVSAESSSTPSINSGTGSLQVVGFSVELGRWHNTEYLESGTVILECKDGRYEALGEMISLKYDPRRKLEPEL